MQKQNRKIPKQNRKKCTNKTEIYKKKTDKKISKQKMA